MCPASQMSEDILSEAIEPTENVRQRRTMKEIMRRRQGWGGTDAHLLACLRYGRAPVIIMFHNKKGGGNEQGGSSRTDSLGFCDLLPFRTSSSFKSFIHLSRRNTHLKTDNAVGNNVEFKVSKPLARYQPLHQVYHRRNFETWPALPRRCDGQTVQMLRTKLVAPRIYKKKKQSKFN